jgi:hypothetical protein
MEKRRKNKAFDKEITELKKQIKIYEIELVKTTDRKTKQLVVDLVNEKKNELKGLILKKKLET